MSYYRILVSDMEELGFHLIIEANSDTGSHELARSILEGCGYTTEQLCSYLLCNEEGVRKLELMPDETFCNEYDVCLQMSMKQVTLEKLFEFGKEEMQCLFLYDFVNEKGLSLSLLTQIDGFAKESPKIVVQKGKAPTYDPSSCVFESMERERYPDEETWDESKEYGEGEEDFVDDEIYRDDLY